MRAGDVVGPYTLVAEIGSGGMGTVWSADGPEGRVALKIVHPHLAGVREFAERFRREGEVGLEVRHENVVRTLAVGSAETVAGTALFLVMELVQGRTLRALLAELGRVPEQLCRHVGREIAKGLAALHAAGAVHRDLKPENVLITADQVVKVMDLGVVRVGGDATRLSPAGAFVGSFHYAAPEQFVVSGGKPIDHRADLHALGILLYELATGRHPFEDDDVHRILRRIADERPRRPSEANPQLSVYFDELVMQLLAKDREKRFASAADVVHVLDAGESSTWWRARATEIRTATHRPLRRIRLPRETALHGREGEMATLAALWEAAKAGEGAVVVVEGEPGIGKSRLLDELAARREDAGDDFHFLHGSCSRGGAATSFGAFTSALLDHYGPEGLEASLAAHLRETPLLVPAFAALLRGDALPRGAEPLTRDAVQTVFVQALRAIAAERPVLLVVEDLDAAPEEGRALFAAVAAGVAGRRVLLAATARPGLDERWLAELDRRGGARIRLSRLGAKDLSRLLVDAFRSERLAEELAFKIAAKSDGNPFFVFEILKGLREDGLVQRTPDGTWVRTQAIREIEIPATVQDLVRARLDGLAETDRHLLEVAACCGVEFDPLLVGAALGLSRMATLQRLASLEKAHRLVRSAGRRSAFDHQQVREVLYAGLSELLREEYHGAIAEALRARGAPSPADAAEIARHFLVGGRAAEAAPLLVSALEHLRAIESFHAAAWLASRFLAARVEAPVARVDLLIQYAEDLATLGRREEERAAVDEAIALAERSGDAVVRARALTQLGWHLTRTGRPRDAVRPLEEAVALAVSAADARAEQSAVGNLGSAFWALGRYDEARVCHERQIRLAQQRGDARAEATAWGNLGLVEYALGRWTQAASHHRRHLEGARLAGDRRMESVATGNLGIVCTSAGRYDEARAHIETQLATARAIGHRRSEAIALGNLGNVHYALGRFADARASLEASLALSLEVENGAGEASTLANLGPLVAELGDPERAADALDRALSSARETGARYPEGYALFEQGELADLKGDAMRAAALHERALALRREIGHKDGVCESLVALARLRAAEGALAAARSHLEEAAALAAELDLPSFAAFAAIHRALGPGGDAHAAAGAFDAHAPRMMVRERMEANWLLGRALRDPARLAEASRLLGVLIEHAPPECRTAMVENVPLHRAIAASR